jgi:hypothetical protein
MQLVAMMSTPSATVFARHSFPYLMNGMMTIDNLAVKTTQVAQQQNSLDLIQQKYKTMHH